ncbi:arylesterase [Candidatus Gracilibacteria bacterium]|nr:arylesterase [Candidatus Gracilibacteria bacterium]
MMQKLMCLGVFLGILVGCSSAPNTGEIQSSETDIVTQDEQKVILALGDSLTAGYGLPIEDSYPSQLSQKLQDDGYSYEIINAGVSGDTSSQLLDRSELYLDQNPDIAIIVIGGNDGLRGLSTDELKENILKIIDLYQENNITIVLGGMDIPVNLGLSYRNDFVEVYQEIADERDVYFFESFLEDVGGVASLNQADRIHPTPEGYDIITDNLYEFLLSEDILQK